MGELEASSYSEVGMNCRTGGWFSFAVRYVVLRSGADVTLLVPC
jgi:hypothetical protein